MKPDILLLLGIGAVGVAGLAYVTRRNAAASQDDLPGTTIIQRGNVDEPNVPWQNKLPSDYEASNYVFNFGGNTLGGSNFGDMMLILGGSNYVFGGSGLPDIDLGDVTFGDVILNNVINQPSVSSTCNVCTSEVSAPLIPYAPEAQAEAVAAVTPDNKPAVVAAITTSRRQVAFGQRAASPSLAPSRSMTASWQNGKFRRNAATFFGRG